MLIIFPMLPQNVYWKCRIAKDSFSILKSFLILFTFFLFISLEKFFFKLLVKRDSPSMRMHDRMIIRRRVTFSKGTYCLLTTSTFLFFNFEETTSLFFHLILDFLLIGLLLVFFYYDFRCRTFKLCTFETCIIFRNISLSLPSLLIQSQLTDQLWTLKLFLLEFLLALMPSTW